MKQKGGQLVNSRNQMALWQKIFIPLAKPAMISPIPKGEV